MNEDYNDCHHRKATRTFLYTQKAKICETFLYSKSQTLFKKLDNSRNVFIDKKRYTLRYGIFMKFLKFAFIFKKHDTLRYVTYLYTKRQTLRKKQDNLRYVFIYKNPALGVTRFFIEFFEICGGGGTFMHSKNNALCVTYLYWKNNPLCFTLLYTKSLTQSVTF